MRILALAISTALVAAGGTFIGAPLTATSVSADVIWEDGVPIFQERRRYRRAPAARRSQGYESYSPYSEPSYATSPRRKFPTNMSGGPRPIIYAKSPPVVTVRNDEQPGTIIIDSSRRKLYYVLSDHEAYAYPISVGREGFLWTGTEKISRVANWPDWHPPAEMRERQPELPVKMTGGLKNPLGAKALYLGKTLYRIHGTNDEDTIGQAASSGCFRMMNYHVVHLASMVEVGTDVKVMNEWEGSNAVAAVDQGWQNQSAY